MYNYPKRKPNRLKNFDYSQNGTYFITICAKNQALIFSDFNDKGFLELSDIGKCIESTIINQNKPNINIPLYVIMPNHIHLIIHIKEQTVSSEKYSVHQIVSNIKSYVTKQIEFSPWQKSFYDHIIRSKTVYCKIVEYIKNNPKNWQDDCFYMPK
ncbi:MAG: hypothetical protein LBM87_00560 [Ruminococcus sp.]|jgi:REP element-mobilizing transposase RayT|nr:hypothetical protein [Ruminococcus sp.]